MRGDGLLRAGVEPVVEFVFVILKLYRFKLWFRAADPVCS